MTDNKAELKEQLEAATGERIAALEAVESERAEALSKGAEAAQAGAGNERDGGEITPNDREPAVQGRGKSAGMDFLITYQAHLPTAGPCEPGLGPGRRDPSGGLGGRFGLFDGLAKSVPCRVRDQDEDCA